MKLRLQTQHQFFVSSVLALTILFLTSALLSYSRYSAIEVRQASSAAMKAELMRQVEVRGKAIGAMLSSHLVNPVYHYKTEAIRRLLADTLANEGIQEVIVTDEKGTIIHDGTRGIRGFGEPVADRQVISALASGKNFYLEDQNAHMLVGFPVRIGDSLIGSVIFRISLDRIQKQIKAMEDQLESITDESLYQQLLIAISISIALFFLSFFFTALLSKYFTRPIKQLADAVTLIGDRDFSGHVDIVRNDEIGELADAFNTMSRRLVEHEAEINHIAYHDPLTDLPNRRLLRKKLAEALQQARRSNTITALMFIDLDDFKQVNDTLGHEAGDLLLKQAAQRISNSLRCQNDVVLNAQKSRSEIENTLSRLGGDEFTILAPGLRSQRDARLIAERVIEVLTQPFIINDQPVAIGASIGITLAPDDCDDVEELLKNADLTMYHAKNTGKNNYQFFEKGLSEKINHVIKLKDDIQKAIENDQFSLYFQPQVSLTDRRIIGAEALIRWKHPEMGWISPADFIPIAEESGQILDISNWVMETTCRYLAYWSQIWSRPFHVGVNFSARQLGDQHLSENLEHLLNKYGINPEWIHVEITETMLINDSDSAIKALVNLKDIGFSVWLDDFGTGYSSLSHLQRFPLKGIKIDRSFVSNMEDEKRDRSLAKGIITLANALDLYVIAEGVETERQHLFLRQWGCEFGQGYLFHKPMPAEKFESLILDGSAAIDSAASQAMSVLP